MNAAQTRFTKTTTLYEEFPLDKLQFPQHIWLYNDHLYSLNLAGTYEIENQKPIMDESKSKQIGVIIKEERRLLEFGQLFTTACVPDNFEGV